jgi:hypothetical protein
MVCDAIDASSVVVPEDSVKIGESGAAAVLACAKSHTSLLCFAKEREYEYAMIFEDDVILCDNFNERVKEIEKLNFEWDMFYLGAHWGKPEDVSEMRYGLYRMNNVGGTYAYIIRNTVYDYVINNISPNFGMDEFYASQVQPRFMCIGFVPFSVGHLDGFSDVANAYVSYDVNKYFQQHED